VAHVIYRDKKTGRFVKKATWKRSKTKGGKRFKRERLKPKRKFVPPPPVPPEEFEEIELIGGFDSPGRKKK